MKLIIVESPTKARTLEKFLGKGYVVLATMGHIRDLPKSKLGIEVEDNFKPYWEVVSGQGKRVKEIQKKANQADDLYLAVDPDREGEAIAYHVAAVCPKKHFKRITFHEITSSAIKKALQNPGKINGDLVNAQIARRVLDRLVGYKLSPVLWRKIRRGLSAGRVQSVTTRLIVEREREIEAFKTAPFWRINGDFSFNGKKFQAELISKGKQKYQRRQEQKLFAGCYTFTKTTIDSREKAQKIIEDLRPPFMVEDLVKRQNAQHPYPPFITSSLQQTAYRFLYFSSQRTMRAAQQLYEKGLITYHRTDSTNLAKEAVDQLRHFIKKEFGSDYLPARPNFYKTKARVAQEAHEAIRPTNFNQQKVSIGRDADRLYHLIWRRAVATQMSDAETETVTAKISSGDYLFIAKGKRVLFDGFWKVLDKKYEGGNLPDLEKGGKLKKEKFNLKKFFTNAPSRYSEATLIAALEEEAIGRPSTYAPIISTIQKRHYVQKEERQFKPTILGKVTTDFLVKHFASIMELVFTAQMEENLDEVANGEKKWQKVIKEFYQPFEKKLEEVEEKAKRVKIPVEKTGKKCPQCKKGEIVIRTGRFGKFLSCSRFPKCKYTASYIEKLSGVKCPQCGGDIVIKRTKKGRRFYGCSNYPKCKWASWRKPH